MAYPEGPRGERWGGATMDAVSVMHTTFFKINKTTQHLQHFAWARWSWHTCCNDVHHQHDAEWPISIKMDITT
jgi:hypothetical protein